MPLEASWVPSGERGELVLASAREIKDTLCVLAHREGEGRDLFPGVLPSIATGMQGKSWGLLPFDRWRELPLAPVKAEGSHEGSQCALGQMSWAGAQPTWALILALLLTQQMITSHSPVPWFSFLSVKHGGDPPLSIALSEPKDNPKCKTV